MKIKLNTNLIVNIIIFCYIAFAVAIWASVFFFTSSTTFTNSKPTDTYTWIDNSKPIDSIISFSVNHDKYLRLTDSIKMERKLKNGDYPSGGGANFADLIGTAENLSYDTCSLKWFFNGAVKDNRLFKIQCYLKLPGWKIKEAKWVANDKDSVKYYVKNGVALIRKTIELPNRNNPKNHVLQLVDVPVKFRYSQQDQCLMIPVSKNLKNVLTIIIIGFGVIWGLYALYLFSGFLKFVIDISKGLSFTNKNVSRLKLIAASLLAYPVIILLLNLLLRLMFRSYFTPDVVLNNDMWNNVWKYVAGGVIFLMLWKAFRQGKRIKEEQDLTV